MKIIYRPDHYRQNPKGVFWQGQLDHYHESPVRAENILRDIEQRGLGEIIEPQLFEQALLERVHREDYLRFLRTVWQRAKPENPEGKDLFPACYVPRGQSAPPPEAVTAQLGYYSFDLSAPITEGTWDAAYASANVALTGQQLLMAGERAVFSLCRPPGHHAGISYCGGFCFLNNAALAAQALRDNGVSRVALLDVDFHHGNGTQDIFYQRSDVLFLSIHGHPDCHYPFFSGHRDERGAGEGHGFTYNYPLYASGSRGELWFEALDSAFGEIKRFKPEVLVVSLGVDTYKNDPVSGFELSTEDYLVIGQKLSALALPTLFVMEGGYNVEAIGENVGNVLAGFSL